MHVSLRGVGTVVRCASERGLTLGKYVPATRASRAGIRLVAASLLVGLASGCSPAEDVDGLEATFAQHYLDPLDAAGITASVTRTCRFDDPVDAPWHLSVQVAIDAPQERVAKVLTDADVVVVGHREPMIVQQIPGEPGVGWDGILAASGSRSTLSLEHSNATHSGWSDALGWGEVCADRP
jgi:hypothetical protein